jgi:hypothetical protein
MQAGAAENEKSFQKRLTTSKETSHNLASLLLTNKTV